MSASVMMEVNTTIFICSSLVKDAGYHYYMGILISASFPVLPLFDAHMGCQHRDTNSPAGSLFIATHIVIRPRPPRVAPRPSPTRPWRNPRLPTRTLRAKILHQLVGDSCYLISKNEDISLPFLHSEKIHAARPGFDGCEWL